MTDPDAGSSISAPVDPAALRWLTPAVAGDDSGREAGALGHAFRIGERWLLIPSELSAEVSPRLFCARLPFTEPWCLGLANFRGGLVPVYHLGGLMDEGETPVGHYFLILGNRDARACLCIDEIAVVTFPSDVQPMPLGALPNLPEELTYRGLEVDGVTYAEIDLGALLGILAQRAGVL